MDPQQRRVEQLVERARDGDRSAQQQLWAAHRRWVAAVVLAHRPRSMDVDDLMQEVALKLVDKLQTLRDAAAFRPWLRQIILNICRGAGRSHRPMLSLANGEYNGEPNARSAACPPARDEQAETTAREEFARCMLDQAMTLPAEYREPLLLRCLNSMTYQQISSLLDVPVTTVETRLARARRMLRDECRHDALDQ